MEQASSRNYKYDIAPSFDGEDRDYVQSVADALAARGVKFFYDELEAEVLLGKNLIDFLDEVYRTKSQYCAMFLSAHYASKLWTRHERQSRRPEHSQKKVNTSSRYALTMPMCREFSRRQAIWTPENSAQQK